MATTILSDLTRDIEGTMFIMFSLDHAQKLASLVTGDPNVDMLNEDGMGQSALKEIGNILTGTSMTALSEFLDMDVVATVPHIATDMLGSVLDSVIVKMVENSNTILAFRVHFSVKDAGITGDLYLMFDTFVTDKILRAMQTKFGNSD